MAYFRDDRDPSRWDEVPDGTLVWRYMPLDKFLSLLVTKQLFFAAATTMEDPWEGAKLAPMKPEDEIRRILDDFLVNDHSETRKKTYLSCWHASDHENAAMWDLYAKREAGIAISTTWGNLRDNLEANNGDKDFFGGRVKYIDYAEPLDITDIFGMYYKKRLDFEHEREVRFTHYPWYRISRNDEVRSTWDLERSDWPGGVPFKMDLPALPVEVLVTPFAASWYADAVKDLVRAYGLNWPVRKSSMYAKPPVPPNPFPPSP